MATRPGYLITLQKQIANEWNGIIPVLQQSRRKQNKILTTIRKVIATVLLSLFFLAEGSFRTGGSLVVILCWLIEEKYLERHLE